MMKNQRLIALLFDRAKKKESLNIMHSHDIEAIVGWNDQVPSEIVSELVDSVTDIAKMSGNKRNLVIAQVANDVLRNSPETAAMIVSNDLVTQIGRIIDPRYLTRNQLPNVRIETSVEATYERDGIQVSAFQSDLTLFRLIFAFD